MNKDLKSLRRYLVAPELIIKNRLGPYKIVRKIGDKYVNKQSILVTNRYEANDYMGCTPSTLYLCSSRCGYIFYLMTATGDILLQTKDLQKS